MHEIARPGNLALFNITIIVTKLRLYQRCYQDPGVRDQGQTKTRQAETETKTMGGQDQDQDQDQDREKSVSSSLETKTAVSRTTSLVVG